MSRPSFQIALIGSILILPNVYAEDPGGPPSGPPPRVERPGATAVRSRLISDFIYHQEAALRTANATLAKAKTQPDETNLYTRNRNELIDNLADVGRVRDAVALAKHTINLPRHPQFGQDAAAEGRRKWLDILTRYEDWTELTALETTDFFEPTNDASEQVQRALAFGQAHFALGNLDKAKAHLLSLGELVPRAEKAEAALSGYQSLAEGDTKAAISWFNKSDNVNSDLLSRLYLQIGDKVRAEELSRDGASRADRLANRVFILHGLGRKDEARQLFDELRRFAERANLNLKPFQRLAPIAKEFGLPDDWTLPARPAGEAVDRTDLATLGPLLYQPWNAPGWRLTDIEGRERRVDEFRGQAVVMIFHLGNGCVHCVEQLRAFRPLAAKFTEAKITLVTVSTDAAEVMRKSRDSGLAGEAFPFVMLSDTKLDTFKAFGAFNDFEKKATHGIFLIDGSGRVRWQDVGTDPFTDAEFLLKEARRLLRQTEIQSGRLPDEPSSDLVPLTEMTATNRYKNLEGGLYGREGNAPPAAHLKLIQEQTKRIVPLGDDGKPAPLGRIVVLGLGGGPAADGFIHFKSRADREPDKVREVVLVDGTQADLDATAWADTNNRQIWETVDRRLKGAGVTDKQVQVIWLCSCLASPGQVGDWPKHAAKLQEDLAATVNGFRDRYPNLRLVYLSSAAYGGYASDKRAGEPFAFETGLAIRGLIQEQISGAARVSKAPILVWGPYLWADGAKSRTKDGLVWKRDDFLPDGVRFSATGRAKAGDALLRFFQEDDIASSWFFKVPR